MFLSYKEFYSTYNNGHVIYEGNKKLIKEINSSNPKSVLEFGCGTGKNLNLIEAEHRFGLDISEPAILDGRKHYVGFEMAIGDEDILLDAPYDVSFTVSVLNHIPKIDKIVDKLLSISDKVFCLESQEMWHKYCYIHDYSKWFKSGWHWQSPFGMWYTLWRNG